MGSLPECSTIYAVIAKPNDVPFVEPSEQCLEPFSVSLGNNESIGKGGGKSGS
jgi:hypothetical protein